MSIGFFGVAVGLLVYAGHDEHDNFARFVAALVACICGIISIALKMKGI